MSKSKRLCYLWTIPKFKKKNFEQPVKYIWSDSNSNGTSGRHQKIFLFKYFTIVLYVSLCANFYTKLTKSFQKKFVPLISIKKIELHNAPWPSVFRPVWLIFQSKVSYCTLEMKQGMVKWWWLFCRNKNMLIQILIEELQPPTVGFGTTDINSSTNYRFFCFEKCAMENLKPILRRKTRCSLLCLLIIFSLMSLFCCLH